MEFKPFMKIFLTRKNLIITTKGEEGSYFYIIMTNYYYDM